MDRELLETKMAEDIQFCSKDQIMDVIRKSIEATMNDGNPVGHRQLIISIEEMSELTKQLTKELRGKSDKLGLLEELADVLICTEYIKAICGISNHDLNKMITIKVNNLEERLETNTYG